MYYINYNVQYNRLARTMDTVSLPEEIKKCSQIVDMMYDNLKFITDGIESDIYLKGINSLEEHIRFMEDLHKKQDS